MSLSRTVTAAMDASINGTADLVLSIAPASDHTLAQESLEVLVDGSAMLFDEVAGPAGARFHVARGLPVGRLTVTYSATIEGQVAPQRVTPLDEIEFVRPSRYCDADRLLACARAELGQVAGLDLLIEATRWVGENLTYVSGSSRPVDSALDTYLTRQGVCRDYAHLLITFLRAYNVPARLVSVYAPGLSPMDFHAIVEAVHEGTWWALDATGLAPRAHMARIATGSDTADTAFMTVTRGLVELHTVEVTAVLHGQDLAVDDPTGLVTLA